ncbi:hypothetical protein ECG_01940 [Echinococcus granulosus]|uniref:Uncharacterized protein n=2 Tax=Echinococcus granulosus TaxID=6210 RepID=A0A068W6U1_ECHGR|nr:hypothetical protein ECG_01940 [Echinococcus granulosus]CDS15095.1 hypothetical protein EgrG_000749600 [Echinococcus granulosus]
MHLLVAVFLCLLFGGRRASSSPPASDATDLVETLIDYLLNVLRLTLPEPMSMNKSPKGLISVENASIYGLNYASRGCPIALKVLSTPTADLISGTLCIDLKDFFKIDAIFKISTFFYDSDPNPATLQLFDFIVRLNVTLTLPKIYQEESGALLKLDGTPTVEMSSLKFIPPPNADTHDTFNFITDLVGTLSAGPIGGYIEMRMAEAVQKALGQINKSMQKSVAKFVNPSGS